MRILIQIPVLNEEAHLAMALQDIQEHFIPKPGDDVRIIIIDDGSTDRSCEVAQQRGITNIVRLSTHQGLGVAFKEGLRHALDLDADIIVNTDADLQYKASQISLLIEPLRNNQAAMVIGDRQIAALPTYPRCKRMAQNIGNYLAGLLIGEEIRDATSGFRALSKEAAQQLLPCLKNSYTYTLESICVLRKASKKIMFVPIAINPALRKSRLIRNKFYYAGNYLLTLLGCIRK